MTGSILLIGGIPFLDLGNGICAELDRRDPRAIEAIRQARIVAAATPVCPEYGGGTFELLRSSDL